MTNSMLGNCNFDGFEGWQSIRGSNLRRTNGACIKYIKRDGRLPRFHRWNPRTALEQFSTVTSLFRFYPCLEGSRALWFLQDFRGQASFRFECMPWVKLACSQWEIAYFIVEDSFEQRTDLQWYHTSFKICLNVPLHLILEYWSSNNTVTEEF